MTGRAGRCPRCDSVHGAGARFCGTCGLDLASAEATELGSQRRAAMHRRLRAPTSSAALAKVAGLVWLAVGVVTGIGAIAEFSTGGDIGAWAVVSAILELVTGVAMFLAPRWELLTAAGLWGALSTIGAAYRLSAASTFSTVEAILVAGIVAATALTWLARRALPSTFETPDSGSGEATAADVTRSATTGDATGGRR